jgi:hypothetical protein
LPSQKLLEPFPRLQKLFLRLAECIKRGELHAFDLALQEGEDEFVKRRIYLTLERGRDIALRNLLRKVYIAGGFEEPKEPSDKPVRRTRIPIAEFAAAISLGSQETVDNDEVECLLANMIYKVRFPESALSVRHRTSCHPTEVACYCKSYRDALLSPPPCTSRMEQVSRVGILTLPHPLYHSSIMPWLS